MLILPPKPIWSTACLDWERRIVARESLIPFSPLFPDEAAAAMSVFTSLRLVDVEGKPTIGEVSPAWILDFAAAIFGAYDRHKVMDPLVARSLIREFFLLVSKKNTKSTLAAAIMLTVAARNWRESAEFLIVAPTVEVAGNSFKPAQDMIAADEELTEIFQVQPHIKTITSRINGTALKVVAADADAVSGKKATAVLIDEYWLFGKRADAENMLKEATGGLISRPEGFVIGLSTMSDEPPAGIFEKKLKYFRGVRDGKIVDPKSLGVLYEFPDDMVKAKAHLEPANFYITNPNLGVSVDTEYLIDLIAKAKEEGEDSLRVTQSKHLNIEMGMNLRSDSWVGAKYWEVGADPAVTLEYILANSEVAAVGIDGGGLDDLLGLAVLGRELGTDRWMAWAHAWAHPSVLKYRPEIATILRGLAEQGQATLVENLGEDIDGVIGICKQVDAAGILAKVGLDPMGVGQIVDALEDAGIEADRIIGISQGWKLSGSIKTVERKLADKTFIHGAQPLMQWVVGNARVIPAGNAITINKAISGSAKIDPLMALFNTVHLMSLNPESMAAKKSLVQAW